MRSALERKEVSARPNGLPHCVRLLDAECTDAICGSAAVYAASFRHLARGTTIAHPGLRQPARAALQPQRLVHSNCRDEIVLRSARRVRVLHRWRRLRLSVTIVHRDRNAPWRRSGSTSARLRRSARIALREGDLLDRQRALHCRWSLHRTRPSWGPAYLLERRFHTSSPASCLPERSPRIHTHWGQSTDRYLVLDFTSSGGPFRTIMCGAA
jgi:hypothetical protein